MTLSVETGTTACPLCGNGEMHHHHPLTAHVAQMIGAWFCGAGRYSPAVHRWLRTEHGQSACELAEEILSQAQEEEK